jgi:tetratricopeptide (TPR) repeat protein
MAIGDMHRGVRNASRARQFYTLAARANPLSSVQYMYAGLTYELEGNFPAAARAFLLSSRVQAHHTQAVCRTLTDVAAFAAACWPSPRRSSTYLAYLSAASIKAGNHPDALAAYLLALGQPPRQSADGEMSTQVLANAATGQLHYLDLNHDSSQTDPGYGSQSGELDKLADARVVQGMTMLICT